MKKILLLLVLLISATAFCQVPQGISYQAIATNGSGNPIVNSNVGVRLSILDGSASGTTLYSETQTKTTNAQGLFNLVIGQGTVAAGTFAGINWSANSKFLKVEMDAAGGSNYALVGTTQLLSVPYALAADSLVTSAGEGITLVSPNGTPYSITVNDAGQLSLPTNGSTSNMPSSLYMYGSFNSYNATTALQLGNYPTFQGCGGGCMISPLAGFKYLTSGTTIKFLTQSNAGSPVYGINPSNELVINGDSYTVASNGFYYILALRTASTPTNSVPLTLQSIAPRVFNEGNQSYVQPTYNVGTNTFSFTVNGVTTSNNDGFTFDFPYPTYFDVENYGDNLSDGTLEYQGTLITFPNVTATPKNFRIDLIINFNGSANYTITQI